MSPRQTPKVWRALIAQRRPPCVRGPACKCAAATASVRMVVRHQASEPRYERLGRQPRHAPRSQDRGGVRRHRRPTASADLPGDSLSRSQVFPESFGLAFPRNHAIMASQRGHRMNRRLAGQAGEGHADGSRAGGRGLRRMGGGVRRASDGPGAVTQPQAAGSEVRNPKEREWM